MRKKGYRWGCWSLASPGRSGPLVCHSTCPQKLFENLSTGLKIWLTCLCSQWFDLGWTAPILYGPSISPSLNWNNGPQFIPVSRGYQSPNHFCVVLLASTSLNCSVLFPLRVLTPQLSWKHLEGRDPSSDSGSRFPQQCSKMEQHESLSQRTRFAFTLCCLLPVARFLLLLKNGLTKLRESYILSFHRLLITFINHLFNSCCAPSTVQDDENQWWDFSSSISSHSDCNKCDNCGKSGS